VDRLIAEIETSRGNLNSQGRQISAVRKQEIQAERDRDQFPEALKKSQETIATQRNQNRGIGNSAK
jgi:hypothetical protein